MTDRHLLALVLRHTGENLSQAARLLGITRATLRAKIQATGLGAVPAETGPPADAADE
jgi:DNA-binding protein Fis